MIISEETRMKIRWRRAIKRSCTCVNDPDQSKSKVCNLHKEDLQNNTETLHRLMFIRRMYKQRKINNGEVD